MLAEQHERLLQDSWGNAVRRHSIKVKQNQAALDHIWVGECLRGRDNNLSVKEGATRRTSKTFANVSFGKQVCARNVL